jgi:hypothetical protein
MFIIPPDVESAWHAARQPARPGATFPRGGFLDQFDKRDFCYNSQFLPDRNLRYRPDDRCNSRFRYSSDFRYKRQSLPPYRQRSSRFGGRVEILPNGAHNRYKPQSLTPAEENWRNLEAW